MFGLGKPRSKFGKFLDRHSITVVEFAEESGVNRKTLGMAANDKDYWPTNKVSSKILKTARKVDPDIKKSDFWDE